MTNQEAITIIGNLEDKDILYNPCDVQDAKTMAIKALEQESFINKPCISEGVCHEDKVKVLDKIRAKIEAEMNDLYRQKSIDQRTLTIIHACQRHIAIIDEYTKGESEIWNTPNADNRIVAPKGTFKKIYEDEDDDNDI